MSIVRRCTIDIVIILAAVALRSAAFSPAWIEHTYANGVYAGLARTFVPLSNRLPFAVGDLLLIALVAGLGTTWIVGLRRKRYAWPVRTGLLVVRTAAVAAVVVIWFDAAWALNYRRVPVVGRVAFDATRVTPATVTAFSKRIIAALNATAPLAHAHAPSEETVERSLAQAFGPVARRLGDTYDVRVSRPKTTLLNWWFATAGIGGTWNPFAYETILNADFLPFERPFALAHEWGHVAGFGDESDANLIAALTTLRCADPFIRYSGLFWAYGFLPDADRQAVPVTPLVAADLAAARARFLAHYNPQLFSLQWFVYDKYLRANRVKAGVVSYSLFVQVLVGTPLDGDGLPVSRPPRSVTARAQAAG